MSIDIIGGALIVGISVYILREFGWRGAPVAAAIGAIVILSALGESFIRIFQFLGGFTDSIGASVVKAILKIFALGYLFGISADALRTIGEQGIAKSVEVVGRVEIFLVVLPFLEEIIRLGVDLI